jgi:hypothetical protein
MRENGMNLLQPDFHLQAGVSANAEHLPANTPVPAMLIVRSVSSSSALNPYILELPGMPSATSDHHPQGESSVVEVDGGGEASVLSAARQAMLQRILGSADDGSLHPRGESGEPSVAPSSIFNSFLDSIAESDSRGHSHYAQSQVQSE